MVGTVTSTDSGFYRVLVEILHRFAQRFPDVHVGLRTLAVGQQLQDLKEDRLTVGFVTLPVQDPALSVQLVHREPLVVALPEGHPPASQRQISARAVSREPHIAPPRHVNPGYFDSLVVYFQEAGHPLNLVHEADNLYSSLALVAAGVGLSLFPTSLLDVPRKGIVVRKLKPSPPMLEMGVAYRSQETSPVLASFLNVLNEFVRKRVAKKYI